MRTVGKEWNEDSGERMERGQGLRNNKRGEPNMSSTAALHLVSLQDNLNLMCDTSRYSLTTQHALSQLNEKEIPFELIEVWEPFYVLVPLFQWVGGGV